MGGCAVDIRGNMAEVIKLARAQRGASITEFAQELEVSRSTLQDYEKGEGNPTVASVQHIAEKLQMDPRALICGQFDGAQTQVLLALLESFRMVSALPASKRRALADLIRQILDLWG